jgi:hypothetical protein
MERNVKRINGEKERLHRLSNEELDNHLSHAYNRLATAQAEVEHLQYERFRRINTALPLGLVAVEQEIDYSTFDDGFSTDGMGRE